MRLFLRRFGEKEREKKRVKAIFSLSLSLSFSLSLPNSVRQREENGKVGSNF